MKKRIISYRKRIDELLENAEESTNWQQVLDEHLVQIGFFQHERLVHLIVTVLFAMLTFLCVMIVLVADYLPALFLVLGFLCLLIPYIFHYYTLENEVQKMYDQYDQILERIRE